MSPIELQHMRSLARAHCAHCSTPGRAVYHFARCPTENRERPVPCAFATVDQAKAGRHTTFQDDGICDRCLGSRRAARITARCADCARDAVRSHSLTAPAAELDHSAATFSDLDLTPTNPSFTADALTSACTAATRVRETGPGEVASSSSSVRPGPVLSARSGLASPSP